MVTKKSMTAVVGEVVDLLTPLESEERGRVVRAALTLLGERSDDMGGAPLGSFGENERESGTVSGVARGWMRQNDLSAEQLQQVFHFADGDVRFIGADVPGKNNREKVRNAYVLLGVARFLSSGQTKFDDKAARAICDEYGIYDQTNHMKYMKGGNEFTGSKEKGWSVTKPGLKHGAILVKGLVA
jgi:hypothetical protein